MIKVYVDGSYNKYKHLAGYGYVILLDNKLVKKQSGNMQDDYKSRNITGECQALIEVMYDKWLVKYLTDHPKTLIEIYYDYLGIEMWATGKWKTNKSVSIQYTFHYSDFRVRFKDIVIKFIKVKSHSNDYWNDVVDQLSKKGCKLII